MDYKSVFTNLCLELQQNRSWIKALGKNPFTHSIPFTHSLKAVPFVRGHRSVFPRNPRNTGVYTRHPTFVTATSGVLTRLPAKLSKNGMRVYTLSDRWSEKKLRVYTASEAKGLRPPKSLQFLVIGRLQNRCGNTLFFLFFLTCECTLRHVRFERLTCARYTCTCTLACRSKSLLILTFAVIEGLLYKI